jgi:hypothetical protein
MAKRKRKNKKQTKPKLKKQPSSKKKLSDLEVDKRLSIVGIPVTFNPEAPLSERIKPASYDYEIIHPNTGLTVVAHISTEMLSKLSAAKGLFLFGFASPRLPDVPKSTWPAQWQYLAAEHLEKLEASGLPVLSQDYILTESLQIDSFFRGLYYSQNIVLFFDSWIEIIWQDYVVEQELRRFQELAKTGQPVVTIEQPNEINLQNAETWIPLENCTVRIRSMWERMHKHIIPVYFTGNPAPNTTDAQYWKKLDAAARSMINNEQLPLYEMLYKAIRDTENSPLKSVRDALIHNLSHRPTGVLPTSSIPDASLPRTVGDLQQLISEERSRIREALIIMAGIIRAKTPINNMVAEDLEAS